MRIVSPGYTLEFPDRSDDTVAAMEAVGFWYNDLKILDVLSVAAAHADFKVSGRNMEEVAWNREVVTEIAGERHEQPEGTVGFKLHQWDRREIMPLWSERDYRSKPNFARIHAVKALGQELEDSSLSQSTIDAINYARNRGRAATYIAELMHPLLNLDSGTDFPFRSFGTKDEARDFWSFVLLGNNLHPGVLGAAGYHQKAHFRMLDSIDTSYGVQSDDVRRKWQRSIEALVYLKMSQGDREVALESRARVMDALGKPTPRAVLDAFSHIGFHHPQLLSDATVWSLDLQEVITAGEQQRYIEEINATKAAEAEKAKLEELDTPEARKKIADWMSLRVLCSYDPRTERDIYQVIMSPEVVEQKIGAGIRSTKNYYSVLGIQIVQTAEGWRVDRSPGERRRVIHNNLNSLSRRLLTDPVEGDIYVNDQGQASPQILREAMSFIHSHPSDLTKYRVFENPLLLLNT